MTELNYREAIIRALAEELEWDDAVFLLGEDIAAAGGVFKATDGLFERFGPRRVRDTPISEQAIIGCAIGAALTGLRPVAEIMFADFAAVCFDQIVNQLAKYRHSSGGQARVPVTIRLANGAGVGFGSQHSQAAENWFLGFPGLKVCVPATPADAYGLLKAAIRDDNPVLVFEHKALYHVTGPLPDGDRPMPLGEAEVLREGRDVTVVATQLMRHRSVEAAARLADEGIDVEIIDPRTLAPLDVDTIIKSVTKTSRLACVVEAPADGSWGRTVISRVVEEAFHALDASPIIISGAASPIPYAASLEDAWLPNSSRIANALRELTSQ